MSTLPLPDKGTASRELLSQARRIERYGVQRRKLLAKVEELDGRIREAKRLFRQLTELIAQSELSSVVTSCCPFHAAGGAKLVECGPDVPSATVDGAR